MKWRRGREASPEREAAEKQLRETQARTQEILEISRKLQEYKRRNHFGEAIAFAMERRAT